MSLKMYWNGWEYRIQNWNCSTFSIVVRLYLTQNFQHLCGTDPHPTQFRAKKYKLEQRFMEKKDFMELMQVKII